MSLNRRMTVTVLILTAAARVFAQCGPDPAGAVHALDSWRALHLRRAAAVAEAANVQPHQNVDVLHVDLDIALDPSAQTIHGTATVRFQATADLPKLQLRLHRSLVSTAYTLDGAPLSGVRRHKDDILFTFPAPLPAGSEHELAVTYGGHPTWDAGGAGGGGVIFSQHDGVAVAATESEPFDAYRWWPLVEDVSDKFTATVHLTVPGGMVGASSGRLISTTANPDGTTTYTWDESHPLATYLVNANVTNYAEFHDTYTALDGVTTMPLDHFVYPEDQAIAEQNFAAIPDMIHFYAGLVGEYAFLDEKFGQVEVPYPGMEHTTLTAVDQGWVTGQIPYYPGDATLMYAHELAHHWWGDDVTCGTWHDVWLNEGFGTYFEALWFAHSNGLTEGEAFRSYDLDGQYAGSLGGTVYVKDDNQPFADEGAVYYKGAWVMHMLRKVLGDDAFFQALALYRSQHHYGSGVTQDFQSACESVYGQSLKWFFDEWVYTPKRPIYHLDATYDAAAGTATVVITQKQKHKIANRTSGADVYVMPVDLTLHYDDGTAQTVTVTDDQRVKSFTLAVQKSFTQVVLDEDGWLLKVVK